MKIKSRYNEPPEELTISLLNMMNPRNQMSILARTMRDVAVLQNDDVTATIFEEASREINKAIIAMNDTHNATVHYFTTLN